MRQLEKVYLLNVLIYINEVNSTRRFLEINHKCREVGMMLRIYTMKKPFTTTKSLYCLKQMSCIPRDIYSLFPRIETIECSITNLYDPTKRHIFEKVKKIRVLISSDDEMKVESSGYEEILKKVEHVKFSFYKKSMSPNNQDVFLNMRKLTLIDPKSVLSFLLYDNNFILSELVLKYTYGFFFNNHKHIINELKELKHFKNICHKSVIMPKTDPDEMKEIEKIFDVVVFYDWSYLDCSEYYWKGMKSISIEKIWSHEQNKQTN